MTNAGRTKKRLITCRARVEDAPAEVRKRWHEMRRLCQQATNRIVQDWQTVMFSAGRDADLRIFLEMYRRWKDGGKEGEKPRLEFYPVDAEWLKRIGALLKETFPTLHARCRSLLLNNVAGHIRNDPSRTLRSLKHWQAVLLSAESLRFSDTAIPIPFDRQNADLVIDDDDTLWLLVRTERFEQADGNATSPLDRARLNTSRRAGRSKYVEWLLQAARDEIGWAGSRLVYWSGKRCWMAEIAVELPAAEPGPAVPAGGTAVLEAPSERSCWLLRLPGGAERRIGSGRQIEHLRSKLAFAKQTSRADPFRAPSRNGRGRRRAMQALMSRSGKWFHVTRTLNQQAASRIIAEARQAGCRGIEYHTPRENCLLATVCAAMGPPWPFYQFREFLERKCREGRLAFEIVEPDSSATGELETICAGSGAE